jgi:hypothetical protein
MNCLSDQDAQGLRVNNIVATDNIFEAEGR